MVFVDLPLPQEDPLTNQEGSLTESRNYSVCARRLNEIVRLEYLDIREAIRPGRIVDEGWPPTNMVLAAEKPERTCGTEEDPLTMAFENGRYTPEMIALQATRGFGPEGTNVIY